MRLETKDRHIKLIQNLQYPDTRFPIHPSSVPVLCAVLNVQRTRDDAVDEGEERYQVVHIDPWLGQRGKQRMEQHLLLLLRVVAEAIHNDRATILMVQRTRS